MSTTPRIEIYSTPTCPDCLALKLWFASKNIPFVDHDLCDPAVAEDARRRAGTRIAPLTVIDGKHIFYGTLLDHQLHVEAIHADPTEGATD